MNTHSCTSPTVTSRLQPQTHFTPIRIRQIRRTTEAHVPYPPQPGGTQIMAFERLENAILVVPVTDLSVHHGMSHEQRGNDPRQCSAGCSHPSCLQPSCAADMPAGLARLANSLSAHTPLSTTIPCNRPCNVRTLLKVCNLLWLWLRRTSAAVRQ